MPRRIHGIRRRDEPEKKVCDAATLQSTARVPLRLHSAMVPLKRRVPTMQNKNRQRWPKKPQAQFQLDLSAGC